ncbi:NifB/NifX family molybdenum-iron cluster-binding protein [Methanococcus voltae]|uniref:Fe-Mo cluster-binding NifX family protein n=2 Tax=Methanococcus voltae TaxID=2188 RepID=A0ABT2EY18_METVO|nr:NifB/NifX family molybdenum-iron cluster-binding protein [Methanococcus voltae]MBP2171759.1 putative Fe-Mo cluster-binding NifX family protein [Methanococcus voltae]MBP2201303.1 putative Fe-Mo cluster-binding NifX family protein [Methanococcus voltae]MCS3922755.1 putative Fe-Mo cluster-binding NifX family protein [Methanococcus voltae PS]
MKICITSTGKELNSNFEQRFGRSSYFIIYDTTTKEFEAIDNNNTSSAHGAGIGSAQLIIEKKAEVLISGNIGPNAKSVLESEGIKVLKGTESTVQDNIVKFEENDLNEIKKAGMPHQGMN